MTSKTWVHFETTGSAFKTVLYLYKDDHATFVSCSIWHWAVPSTNASDVEAYVDPGTYYLVVDGYLGQGGPYRLEVNAIPDTLTSGTLVEPNYEQAMAAYKAIGGKFVGIDSSGYTCGTYESEWFQRFVTPMLNRMSTDTGSLNGTTSAPFNFAVSQYGNPCKSTDAPMGKQVSDAIIGIANTARMDVTAVAIDTDDSRDFDGTGGPRVLTPTNVDDATFVQSIATVHTAESDANCTQTLTNKFVQCLPGTHVTFQVNFQTPAAVVAQTNDQIFSFVVRTLRDGIIPLSDQPVVIVVPNSATKAYTDAWFVRDYDAKGACPPGSVPTWGLWGWNATTPRDSRIDYSVAVADSVAELATAPADPLLFSASIGPAALANTPIGVVSTPSTTESGSTVVNNTLLANNRAPTAKALRMRAHLMPTADRLAAPTLQAWNLQISCTPRE